MYFNSFCDDFNCGIVRIGSFSPMDLNTSVDDIWYLFSCALGESDCNNPLLVFSTSKNQKLVNNTFSIVGLKPIKTFVNNNTGNTCFIWAVKMDVLIKSFDKYYKFNGQLNRKYKDWVRGDIT